MHISSGRWVYGLFLALLTAFLWGILPIKLKEVLRVMNPVTVTGFRLLVSGSLLFGYLAAAKRLPAFRSLGKSGYWLVAVAILGLVLNYVLYLVGLKMLSPGTTQLVIQMAPILLLISGVFIFKESFGLGQWLGLIVILVGFSLFFNQHLQELPTSLSTYTLGILTILLAALVWAFYGLAQKQLLTVWNSLQVMMVIYLKPKKEEQKCIANAFSETQQTKVIGQVVFASFNTGSDIDSLKYRDPSWFNAAFVDVLKFSNLVLWGYKAGDEIDGAFSEDADTRF